MEKNPWRTLSKKTVYDNPWIEVSHRQVTAPSGQPGIYGKVHFKNIAIGIVPIDSEGYTWLVGQHRYTLDTYSWEIPEGGGDPNIEPVKTAQRELQEETGLHAKRWTPLLTLHTSNSVTDELGYAFIAQELTQGAMAPDETEVLQLKRLPLVDAIAMAMEGEITDALAIASLFKVQLLIDRKQLTI